MVERNQEDHTARTEQHQIERQEKGQQGQGMQSPGGGGTPILLACNKANLGAAAYSPDFIRKRLEREVEAAGYS